ncbi:HAD-IB family phosphatase [Hippea jasoniae]|uniref:HAD-IB family phosphatase n=1 Tax=Hippea jasoniae TaxID=944479 RepID=UPI000559190B|nr:HAD-IB family phosphatase [Hippea jasoniae]
MNSIAFFDFDGTLTFRDTFLEFLKDSVDVNSLAKKSPRLFYYLSLFEFKVISNSDFKLFVVRELFKSEDYFRLSAQRFSKKIFKFLKSKAVARLMYHKKNGDKVVIVSASFEEYLKDISKQLCVDLIATKITFKDNVAYYDPANCYGIEKYKRIISIYRLDKFKYIYAYGDSRGDYYMLKIADYPYYRVF